MKIQRMNNIRSYNQSFRALIVEPEAKKIMDSLKKLSGDEIAQYDELIKYRSFITNSKYYDYVIGTSHNLINPKVVSIKHYIIPKNKQFKYSTPKERGCFNKYHNEYSLELPAQNMDDNYFWHDTVRIQGSKETLDKLDKSIQKEDHFASLITLFEALENEPNYIQNEIIRLRKALFKIES